MDDDIRIVNAYGMWNMSSCCNMFICYGYLYKTILYACSGFICVTFRRVILYGCIARFYALVHVEQRISECQYQHLRARTTKGTPHTFLFYFFIYLSFFVDQHIYKL